MSFKLINNTYQANQAKELITKLVNDKIALLHKHQNKQIRLARITELRNTLQDINELLDLAEANNWKVHVDAEINITLKQ
jgi:hypothetical protein